jgi:urease accessory protein
MRRRAAIGIAAPAIAALALTLPTVAEAHLVATGMGPIYDGVTHFGLSPEDWLPVIGLGFYAGLRGPADARAALAAVTLGWLGGGALAMAGLTPPPIVLPALTALLYLGIGGLLAANRAFKPAMTAGVGVALGVVRGVADLVGVPGSLAHALTLLGMGVSVFVVLALAVSVTLPMRRLWMIVAARVSGSWLAALGLLFAGWILRFGAAVQ